MNDGRELYYSLEAVNTLKRIETQYVYRETGLTLGTLYNDDDYRLYNEVAREILPEPLDNFLLKLIISFPALEKSSSGCEEEKKRLREYLEEIIREEEDGGEL